MYFDDIIGKTVEAVDLDKAADRITLRFQDGFVRSYGVEGDCCSQSWIEHLEMPDDVKGAVIQSVDDGGEVEPWDGHVCKEYNWDKSDDENKAAGVCDHDVLAVYNTRFHTNKGDIVLEYRNDSNGYYGGYLVD
jgi:hypothetical protein